MNNLPIKFLSVEIRNFRGVPDVLQIPLNAPLTIIHAANGTGKSTICYALEWLLTNKVDDLPTTLDFSCQWGDGDTSVSAECEINGETCYLERVNGKAALKKMGRLAKRRLRMPNCLRCSHHPQLRAVVLKLLLRPAATGFAIADGCTQTH